MPDNRWALVVGVSAYSAEIGPLRYPAKEARDFAAELTGKLAFDNANVRLLADGGAPEEEPTSAHILSALDSLLADRRLDKANLFVFYFSGHGVATPKGDFLLPADVRKDRMEEMGVPVKDVITRIVNAGLKNVLFIADACRAGTENDFGSELSDLCHKANIAVMLGCAPGRRSYEYPRLRGGVFTHFLIQDLEKSELRDASGTLWASKVGLTVQKQVHDYTEPDYGEQAQVPTLWAEQSTLDVLLATYPQKPVSDEAVKTFKKSVEKLGKKDFGAAMTAYAERLEEADRNDECVEMLKAVDQLGELTPLGRTILAASLNALGRSGEATRVYDSFLSMPDSYFRDLAIASSPSRALDPKERIKVGMKLLQSDPVWVDKMLGWATVHKWGTAEQILHACRLFAAATDPSERKTAYAKGCLAVQEGRWADADAAFKRAAKAPGDTPTNELFYISRAVPVFAQADDRKIAQYLDEGVKDEKTAAFAFLQKAGLAQVNGDAPHRIEYLKAALTHEMDPEELWTAMKVAGAFVALVPNEIKAVASRFPYSWRARLALALVDAIQGNKSGSDADILASDRYMDDPLNYYAEYYDFLESVMSEEVLIGALKEPVYRGQVDNFFQILLRLAPQFGYDADLWSQLLQYGMLNERNIQVAKVVARYVPFKPEAAPKALRPVMLYVAMNLGDTESVRKMESAEFEARERSDPAWLFAAYEVTLGNEAKALKMIEGLPKPSAVFLPRMEAMRTYLLAKAGRKPEALQRLRTEVNDLVVRAFDGLAWAALGDWKKAEPLLAEQARSRNWAFLFVQEYALRILDAHYRALGRIADSRELAHSALLSQPGNPLFDRYTFVAKPGVAQFAGSIQMDAIAIDDLLKIAPDGTTGDGHVEGRLWIAIGSKGAVTLGFNEKGGIKHAIGGRIDPLGNVTAKGKWNDRAVTLYGKVAPADLYTTFAGFKNPGQVFQLVDDQGYRIAIVGRVGG